MDATHAAHSSSRPLPVLEAWQVTRRQRAGALVLSTLLLSMIVAPLTGFALPLVGVDSASRRLHMPTELKPAQLHGKIAQQLERAPLTFVENRGLMDERVAYYVPGSQTTFYLTHGGVTIAQTGPAKSATATNMTDATGAEHASKKQRWVVQMAFAGANPAARVQGDKPVATTVSYFHGAPSEWKTSLPTYGRITYTDMWPGIDAVYSGSGGQLKYAFMVRPGADPRQIRLAYSGATSVQVTNAGQLTVATPVGGFVDDAPVAYQESTDGASQRTQVAVSYAQDSATSGSAGTTVYGFRVGAYDTSKPLVVDPAIITYAGYIGGAGYEAGNAIAVDAAGNAYIAGETDSDQLSFPVTAGPDLTYNGGGDAFVAKVQSNGMGFTYVGYIGGSQYDHANGIAIDSAGNAYVTGGTNSDQGTFPVTVGPDLTYNRGGDAFVAKVNAAGTALIYCGYLGGGAYDTARGIAVDSASNAYVTGTTFAPGSLPHFPVTVGPDVTFNGASDAFITKVRPNATLAYSGYIGGVGDESGSGVTVDGSGQAYVIGNTTSSQATFPVAGGPDLTYNGSGDAFVSKVAASGVGLIYSGYIGGSGGDNGAAIAIDGNGAAYIAGQTESDQATFPVKVGPDLTYNGGLDDGFIAKVQPSGAGLVYAGYIGGDGIDGALGVAVDAAHNAYVTGNAGAYFVVPIFVVNGPDSSYNGGQVDAYVAKLSASGAAYAYCGYVGGSNDDVGYAIAVDSGGNAYVTGYTGSAQATFPVMSGPDLTYNGGSQDAFVAKIRYP
jgi:Beta-propeller repeat